MPINPHSGAYASTTDAETWGTLEDALERPGVDGIGFVSDEDDDLVGVDLDDCRDPEAGESCDTARDIVQRLDSYTEVSPSGTGYHVILRGELPERGNRSDGVEMYDSSRFFTVTGDHVDWTPETVARRQDALAAVHEAYVHEAETDDGTAADSDNIGSVSLPDEALHERAFSAENGAKFEHLWNGSTTGYESHSEADMALCCLLAFWTAGDGSQMDRLFRQSGQMRDKWDEVHYADGTTHGEKTIERAINQTSERYEPSLPRDDTDDGSGDSSQVNTWQRSHRGQSPSEKLQERMLAIETTVEHLETAVAALESDVESLKSDDKGGTDDAAANSRPQTEESSSQLLKRLGLR